MPFEHTSAVAIELSNICSYAWFHKRCPLNLELESAFMVKEPKILPANTVFYVLHILAKHGFAGKIAFHQYNEPLMDPRLFMFIKAAKDVCPESHIYIVTNGYYLTRSLVQELAEAGVASITVSLYGSESEIESKTHRFSKMAERMPIHLGCVSYPHQLDNRLSLYSGSEIDIDRPCHAPLGQVVITRDADVGLCCMDWKRQHTFGNLDNRPLAEILLSPEVKKTYEQLARGDRFLDICKRCGTAR